MAGIETKKVRKSYTQDGHVVITDVYIDGDLFQSKEEYYDKDGYLVYEYIYDKSPGQLLKVILKREQPEENKPDTQRRDKINKKLNKNRRRG